LHCELNDEQHYGWYPYSVMSGELKQYFSKCTMQIECGGVVMPC